MTSQHQLARSSGPGGRQPRFSRSLRSSASRSTGCHGSIRSSSRNSAGARQQVTSGNAYSKIAVAIAFGFIAGRIVDRIRPAPSDAGRHPDGRHRTRRTVLCDELGAFYFFYAFNALGYVCGGPLPNQVLLSRWFDKGRGKAMGIAYLGIGVGGALVPLLAYALDAEFRLARRTAMAWRPDDSGLAAGCVFRARAERRSGRRTAASRFRSRRSCRVRPSICCSSAAWRPSAPSVGRCRTWRCI